MKKLLLTTTLLFLSLLTLIAIILSTIGIETKAFNNFITKKIYQANRNVTVVLNTIKFKIDIKELSLFLETENPKVNYKKNYIPTKNIKVYLDFISLIKSENQIKKINANFKEIDFKELKKMSLNFKPSNFNSLLNNKVLDGKLDAEIEIFFNKENLLDNFIARGFVSNLKVQVIQDFILEKTSFNFFSDKSDILIKNLSSQNNFLKIEEGDLKVKVSPKIELESNFFTKINYNANKNNARIINNLNTIKFISEFDANLNNSFKINFDKTFKVKSYSFKNSGKINKAASNFQKPLANKIFLEDITRVSIKDTEIEANYSKKESKLYLSGAYALNEKDFLPYELENRIKDRLLKSKINFDYKKGINLDFINYFKSIENIANIKLDLEKSNEDITFKKVDYTEKKNKIIIEDLKLKKNKFSSIKSVQVKTFLNGKNNNDFKVKFGNKILLNGTKFDASNLPKFLNKKNDSNILSNLNSEIEIDFSNVSVPLAEELTNFKLIGNIDGGKFSKISSKGSFGQNNFLDIFMKNDKKKNKKYLEVYSDLTKPLLTEFSFFRGLTGGKLFYSSVIEKNKSNSKLKIENFKVVNAPGMIKLLSLADLSGLVDLAQGEGLTFDILEIQMEKTKDTLNLNEILAIGPSISVIMEGYQNSEVTSLRGTLVPAKTLNKMISKIPVIGDIVIPKEVGEGLFGISFKMKGPPGKIKLTINPIRTITPRFIQKIIEKNKKTK